MSTRADAASLRVLVLAPHPYFQDRGTPIAVHALVRGLVARGYDVDLLTYHEGEDRDVPGCTHRRTVRVPGVRGIPPGMSWKKVVSDVTMTAAAARLARRRRFDVVHAIEEACFIALALKRTTGVPYVYDMDSSLPQQLIERSPWLRPARRVLEAFERRAVRGSIGVVAVNRALEQLALATAHDQIVTRLEDFSLLDGGAPEGAAAESLRALTGSNAPVILYVGNLMPYQGIDLLLDGFLHATQHGADAQLIIIGGADADIAAYRTRASALGIGARTHFPGPRPADRLGEYLRQADVLVSPRITGVNTPMKIYSYLDSGVPVVATRLPTHLQVLDDDIAHLVAPEPAAFGDGLIRLLRDATLRRRLADGARRRVRREHSREAYVRKLNAFYDEVEQRLEARPRAS